jgi:hypothetical protein
MVRTEVKISIRKKYSACLYFKLLKSYPNKYGCKGSLLVDVNTKSLQSFSSNDIISFYISDILKIGFMFVD